MNKLSQYLDYESVKNRISKGDHRNAIGGMWDDIGKMQIEFIRSQGMTSEHNLLDVGCGCFRGGLQFIDFLKKGNYYAIEMHQSLIDAGLKELDAASLKDKLVLENISISDVFAPSAHLKKEPVFDFGIAVSVFSHLGMSDLRLCLLQLEPYFRSGGSFYVTYFELPSDAIDMVVYDNGHIKSYYSKNPFHYQVQDLENIVYNTSWKAERIGDWGHPRGQYMFRFCKS
jgi:hypothetical protein